MRDTPFRVGDWRVDPAAGRISRNGKTVRLEPRVVDVLVYLAERAGRVVSREELEAAVWAGRVVSYDALTSTVQKLRKGFADDARQPRVIETLSKKGYRLVAPVSLANEPDIDQGPADQGRVARHNRLPRIWAVAAVVLLAAIVAIAFRIGSGPTSPETHRETASTNSIAVLPFDNLSGDPAQEYFADGMTDDLITDLARNPDLLVIARDSTFLYKGRAIDIPAIAQRLNVRFVLHGSIRRIGEQMRLNAQLVDATSRGLIWAERYDAPVSDLHEVEAKVTRQIRSALATTRRGNGRSDPGYRKTRSPAAYDYFLHGRNRFFRYANKRENREARELYRKAIALDPGFGLAYAMLAWTHAFEAMNGWNEDREGTLERALALATRAMALDEALPVAHFVRGLVLRELGEYTKALVAAEAAIAIEPNYANAHVLLATLLYYTGRPEEGLEKMKRAIRLNPHHPYNYPFHLAQAHFILGEYEEAIEALERGLESNPSSERMRVWLAAAYAQAGRKEDAAWEAEQVLAVNPDFSLERIRHAFPFKNPSDLERLLDGLQIAGISDLPGERTE